MQMARDMDLIFLDIDMESVNGIQLAAKFREVRKDSILIFVTNYGEYAAEGYEVNAFRFCATCQWTKSCRTILKRQWLHARHTRER